MVYLPTGSSDLILILGCMTFNFLFYGELIPSSSVDLISPPPGGSFIEVVYGIVRLMSERGFL